MITISPKVVLSAEKERTRAPNPGANDELAAPLAPALVAASRRSAMARYCRLAGPSNSAIVAFAAAPRTLALESHAITFTKLVDTLFSRN